MARFGRRAGAPDDDADYLDDPGEPPPRRSEPAEPGGPMRMRGREPLWGYLTAGVLAAGAIANLVDTTGKGAVTPPVLWPSYLGLVLAAGLVASMRLRNRLLSPFVAIIAAFFITLERGPDSLAYPHVVILFAAVGFAVALTMRQRREQKALGGPPARGGSGGRRRRDEPADDQRSRKPEANRRYTPPKSARTGATSRSRTGRR